MLGIRYSTQYTPTPTHPNNFIMREVQYNTTMWILAGNGIKISIAASSIRLHMIGVT